MKKRIVLYWVGLAVFILVFISYYSLVKIPSYKRMLEVQKKRDEQKVPDSEPSTEASFNIKEFIKEDAPMDIILILDQSGSMRTTDPENTRIKASEYVINNIAEKSTANSVHRIGIVEFGSEALPKNQVPLTEVSHKKGTRSAVKKLKARNLGDTNFKSAFARAYKDLEKHDSFRGDRKIKVIVFTDGVPDDSRRLNINAYFSEISNFLNKKFKGVAWDLYVVVCDRKGSVYKATGAKWKKIAGVSNIFHIRNVADLNSTFNQIVCRMFDIDDSIPAVTLSQSKREENFEVQPYIDRMEFHILAAPGSRGLEVAVLKPDGKNLLQSLKTDKRTQVRKTTFTSGSIIVVTNPAPGTWKYRLTKGRGKVDIYRNEMPIRFAVISPDPSRSYYPQGKPMLIKLTYQRKDGEPIREDPENPIIITGTVFAPGKKDVIHLKFNKDKSGLLVADKPVDTSQKGICTIVMSFKGGVKKFEYKQIIKISVVPLPYLVIESPSRCKPAYLGKTIPIEVKAMMAGKPLDVKSFFSKEDHPDSLVMVTYKETAESDNFVSKHIPLKSGATDTFFVEGLPLDHSKQGSYLIKASINGTPADKNASMQEDSSFLVFQSVTDPAISGGIEQQIAKDKKSYWLMKFPVGFFLIGNVWFLLTFFALAYISKPGLGNRQAEITVNGNSKAYRLSSAPMKIIKIQSGRMVIVCRDPKAKKSKSRQHGPPPEVFSAGIINWFGFVWFPQCQIIKKSTQRDHEPARRIANSKISIKIY
ncbi:MAG: VWA domain-containing protein [Candidatus Eremiobacteraeota bacterium]|nr:VWA domain-containing protein [Candidatus Eremiobacteraeota bacterium]